MNKTVEKITKQVEGVIWTGTAIAIIVLLGMGVFIVSTAVFTHLGTGLSNLLGY